MDIIKVENLSFVYPAHKEALKDINLVIQRGDFVVVSGANGCGKTTFLKCLNGLLKPTHGKVSFKGQDTLSVKPQELFSKIGYSFQDPNDQLFAATVRQDVAFGPKNLELSPDEVERRVDEALALLNIQPIQAKFIHDLSHGSKQRVALAGILAMQPEVLLLDEPTASLDPQTEDEILIFLRKLNQEKGLTIVMATHEMDLIPEFANRVVILADGVLVREGNLEEIFGCAECLPKGRLRLPIVTQLLESLKQDGVLSYQKLPLTFKEARQLLKEQIKEK